MHLTEQQVLTVLLGALATINAAKPPEERFVPAADTPLVGHRAVLTSLELVTFILEAETQLAEEFGLHITLTDDRAFSQAKSPFRRPSALSEYIVATAETAKA
jgi:hypothetical protein